LTAQQGEIMEIIEMDIGALVPYARNSRTHGAAQVGQIAGSIREFGFTNPVLIDGKGGIIAGHGRVMAAQKLGLERVPCIRLAHLTEAQKRAYVIADNKLALNAGWDEEMLRIELEELKALDFDLAMTGFDAGELEALFADGGENSEGQGDADAVPAPRPEAISKPGDVWVLGKHRVMCGDSTSIDAAGVLMGGGHG
jgi:ParB-like chromosome segregation protein Spo0J